MTKAKVSILDTINHRQVDKESFVYGKKIEGETVERLEGEKVNRVKGGKAKSDDFKKVSLYMPKALWLKYKEYELAEIQKGNDVTINGLAIELLEKFLTTE